MAEADTTRLAGRWHARRTPWPEVGVLILGALISVTGWWVVRGWETRHQAAAVWEQVAVNAQALAEALRYLVGDVQVLAQFYDASDAAAGE